MTLMPPLYWICIAIAAMWLLNLVLGTAITEAWSKSSLHKRLTQKLTDLFDYVEKRWLR